MDNLPFVLATLLYRKAVGIAIAGALEVAGKGASRERLPSIKDGRRLLVRPEDPLKRSFPTIAASGFLNLGSQRLLTGGMT